MILNYDKLLEKIRNQLSEDCIESTIRFIRTMTKNYSEVLGYSECEILTAIENERNYCASKYYQESNFPLLNEKVKVFSTVTEFLQTISSNKFICPFCKQEQSDPYSCKSNYEVNGTICNKKSSGAIDLGFRFTIKDSFLENPIVENCFLPVNFLNTQYDQIKEIIYEKN